MSKKKKRPTYPKELRKQAKEEQKGLLTIGIEFLNGERMEEQGVFSPEQLMFVKWVMAMMFCEEVRTLPKLEGMIRELMS